MTTILNVARSEIPTFSAGPRDVTVIESEGFPSAYLDHKYDEVEIGIRRLGDRRKVTAWLRALADALDAAVAEVNR